MTAQTERMREALHEIGGLTRGWSGPEDLDQLSDAVARAVEIADAALAQPPAPEQQAPQGWKLVPVEPTASMEYEGARGWHNPDLFDVNEAKFSFARAVACYKAMLADSPAAPEAAKPAAERTALVNRLLSLLDDQTLVLEEDQEDIIKEAAALLAADSKAVGEPDWKHSTIQGVMGANARNRITIDLIWKVIENPEYELTPRDMEYWDAIHDALKAALTRPKQQQAKPLSDETRDFMVLEHLGPSALTGGAMSIYDAFMLGIDAAETEYGIGKD